MWVTLTDDKFFHIYRNTWKLLTCLSTHFEQDGRIIACTEPLVHFLSTSYSQWSWHHHHSQIIECCWRNFHSDGSFAANPPPTSSRPDCVLCPTSTWYLWWRWRAYCAVVHWPLNWVVLQWSGPTSILTPPREREGRRQERALPPPRNVGLQYHFRVASDFLTPKGCYYEFGCTLEDSKDQIMVFYHCIGYIRCWWLGQSLLAIRLKLQTKLYVHVWVNFC